MVKIDLKDKKILYELDLDSRQSFRSIGRKVGLSKDVVASRVNKLQENGIITNYCAIIDYSKIGYSYYRFYFSFQNVTIDKKTEIIDYFVNDEHTDSVRSLEGSYDMMVFIFVKNYPDANSFWINTLKKYGKYFSKKVFTAYSQEDYYGLTSLFNENEFCNINKKLVYQLFIGGETVKIDNLDFQILKQISQNCRKPTTDISKELNTTSTVVQNRLKKLMELKIIIGYKINLDFTKLGYYTYKVDIELNQFDKINNIIKYFSTNLHLDYIFKTIGYVDLELGLILKNSYQLHQIMEEVSKNFPGAIKNYTYFSVVKSYKSYGV